MCNHHLFCLVSKGKAVYMLRKSTMLGTKRKMPKRYELDWKDYRLHRNLPNLKIKLSKEQYDFMKSEDEEIKDD